MNKEGVYFISKFRSSSCRKFGKEDRNYYIRMAQVRTPGPGSYRSPSEFGHYQAQEKYCAGDDMIKGGKSTMVIKKIIRPQSSMGHTRRASVQ